MEEIRDTIDKLVEWIAAKKGEDIVEIYVREKSAFTDYFIICTAHGEMHTKAIANHLIDKAKENKIHLMGSEGIDNAKWILLDFADVVVHIFDAPVRGYYELEALWQKMPVRNNT